MPPEVRAELIGGVVYMPSPLKPTHGSIQAHLLMWLCNYKAATTAANVYDNTTDKLGDDCEVQPDAMLLLSGGQTHEDAEGYIVGPPELAAEVASSSESIDLHAKKLIYERYGVREYLVVVVRQKRAVWFVRNGSKFDEVAPSDDGILRSPTLPGLWLDSTALFRGDLNRVNEVLNAGLQTPEHAAFAAAGMGAGRAL